MVGSEGEASAAKQHASRAVVLVSVSKQPRAPAQYSSCPRIPRQAAGPRGRRRAAAVALRDDALHAPALGRRARLRRELARRRRAGAQPRGTRAGAFATQPAFQTLAIKLFENARPNRAAHHKTGRMQSNQFRASIAFQRGPRAASETGAPIRSGTTPRAGSSPCSARRRSLRAAPGGKLGVEDPCFCHSSK